MEPTSPLATVMSAFFLNDCRLELNSDSGLGLSLEDQWILLNGCVALRERVLALEQDMLKGRPELFEEMAEKVAQDAVRILKEYFRVLSNRALENCVWEAMLARGFRGHDIRQRAFAIACEMIRAEKS